MFCKIHTLCTNAIPFEIKGRGRGPSLSYYTRCNDIMEAVVRIAAGWYTHCTRETLLLFTWKILNSWSSAKCQCISWCMCIKFLFLYSFSYQYYAYINVITVIHYSMSKVYIEDALCITVCNKIVCYCTHNVCICWYYKSATILFFLLFSCTYTLCA